MSSDRFTRSDGNRFESITDDEECYCDTCSHEHVDECGDDECKCCRDCYGGLITDDIE